MGCANRGESGQVTSGDRRRNTRPKERVIGDVTEAGGQAPSQRKFEMFRIGQRTSYQRRSSLVIRRWRCRVKIRRLSTGEYVVNQGKRCFQFSQKRKASRRFAIDGRLNPSRTRSIR